jgi:phosphate transport system substrate-binding protein
MTAGVPASHSSSRQGLARIALFAALAVVVVVLGTLYLSNELDSSPALSGSVQVVGSESMRPVVAACAEDFMSRNPQADIIVKGGGSGDGLAALLHGLADIGMASRELSSRELDYASSKAIELTASALALDAITVVVHRMSTVSALDLGQLRDIFTGNIRNWRDVGGEDAEILAVGRAAGSGTESLFKERVLGEHTYAPSVRQLATNEAIVGEVAARPGSIGYAGLGALRTGGDRVKSLALRADAQSDPVGATPAAIRSGRYPLARKLYLVASAHPSGTAKAFLDFCSGQGGRALVERAGYVEARSAIP